MAQHLLPSVPCKFQKVIAYFNISAVINPAQRYYNRAKMNCFGKLLFRYFQSFIGSNKLALRFFKADPALIHFAECFGQGAVNPFKGIFLFTDGLL